MPIDGEDDTTLHDDAVVSANDPDAVIEDGERASRPVSEQPEDH